MVLQSLTGKLELPHVALNQTCPPSSAASVRSLCAYGIVTETVETKGSCLSCAYTSE